MCSFSLTVIKVLRRSVAVIPMKSTVRAVAASETAVTAKNRKISFSTINDIAIGNAEASIVTTTTGKTTLAAYLRSESPTH